MKKFTNQLVLALAFLLIGTVSVFAQPTNYDANGAGVVDSIAIGGTSAVLVAPDAALSPAFNINAPAVGDVTTTFSWSDNNGNVSFADHYAGGAATTNWSDITAGTVGTGTISIEEGTATCTGTPVTINYEVVALPTANYNAGTSDAICTSQPDTVSYNFGVALTTAVLDNAVRINVNVDGPATADIYDGNIDLSELDTQFNLPAGTFNDGAGDYTITILTVNDRIARKSGINGTVTTDVFTLTMNPVPSTGTIYHLQNSGW